MYRTIARDPRSVRAHRTIHYTHRARRDRADPRSTQCPRPRPRLGTPHIGARRNRAGARARLCAMQSMQAIVRSTTRAGRQAQYARARRGAMEPSPCTAQARTDRRSWRRGMRTTIMNGWHDGRDQMHRWNTIERDRKPSKPMERSPREAIRMRDAGRGKASSSAGSACGTRDDVRGVEKQGGWRIGVRMCDGGKERKKADWTHLRTIQYLLYLLQRLVFGCACRLERLRLLLG